MAGWRRLGAAWVSVGLLVAVVGCDAGGPGAAVEASAAATAPASAPSTGPPLAPRRSPAAPAPDATSSSTSGPSAGHQPTPAPVEAPTPAPTGPAPASTAPVFRATVTTVSAADLHASWRPGCPVGPRDLRAVEVTHWGYDGQVHTGRLVVAAELAASVEAVMGDLFAARFPIERMTPVEAYDGDDDASMAANNTSAFNCRAVTGGSSWSEHSYGRAIDVNPLVNPYVAGAYVAPPGGAAHLDRDAHGTGMIRAGDATVEAFAAHGWIWGGTWSSPKDYQHFSTTGG